VSAELELFLNKQSHERRLLGCGRAGAKVFASSGDCMALETFAEIGLRDIFVCVALKSIHVVKSDLLLLYHSKHKPDKIDRRRLNETEN
jgi:hypothetical protein